MYIAKDVRGHLKEVYGGCERVKVVQGSSDGRQRIFWLQVFRIGPNNDV